MGTIGGQKEKSHKIAMFNILVALSSSHSIPRKLWMLCMSNWIFSEHRNIAFWNSLKFVDSYYYLRFGFCCCYLIGWMVGWLKDINLNILLRYTIELQRIWNAHNHIFGYGMNSVFDEKIEIQQLCRWVYFFLFPENEE